MTEVKPYQARSVLDWMGDRRGTLGAVGDTYFPLLSLVREGLLQPFLPTLIEPLILKYWCS